MTYSPIHCLSWYTVGPLSAAAPPAADWDRRSASPIRQITSTATRYKPRGSNLPRYNTCMHATHQPAHVRHEPAGACAACTTRGVHSPGCALRPAATAQRSRAQARPAAGGGCGAAPLRRARAKRALTSAAGRPCCRLPGHKQPADHSRGRSCSPSRRSLQLVVPLHEAAAHAGHGASDLCHCVPACTPPRQVSQDRDTQLRRYMRLLPSAASFTPHCRAPRTPHTLMISCMLQGKGSHNPAIPLGR